MLFKIIDIETTGLNKLVDDILEVGYMTVNENLEMVGYDQFYFYREDFNIESQAQKVHGLTRDFLRQYESEFTESLAKLWTIHTNSIIIGKNNKEFDSPFIISFLNRYTADLEESTPRGWIDLQQVFTPVFQKKYQQETGRPTNKKGTLVELIHSIGYSDAMVKDAFIKTFGPERAQAHSALYDVFMTYLLLNYAVKHLGLELVCKK